MIYWNLWTNRAIQRKDTKYEQGPGNLFTLSVFLFVTLYSFRLYSTIVLVVIMQCKCILPSFKTHVTSIYIFSLSLEVNEFVLLSIKPKNTKEQFHF